MVDGRWSINYHNSFKSTLFYLKIWIFQIKVVPLQRQKIENVY